MRYKSMWADGLVLVLWTVEEVPFPELSWLFDMLRAGYGR